MVFPSPVRIETEFCRAYHCKTTVILSIVRDKARDLIFGKSHQRPVSSSSSRKAAHSPLLNKIAWNLPGVALDGVPICPNQTDFLSQRGSPPRHLHKIEPDLLGSHDEVIWNGRLVFRFKNEEPTIFASKQRYAEDSINQRYRRAEPVRTSSQADGTPFPSFPVLS